MMSPLLTFSKVNLVGWLHMQHLGLKGFTFRIVITITGEKLQNLGPELG
jgi:hypothetical protein